MEAEFAKTFDEHIAWMATNSPHATILDWWRKIDRALDDFASAHKLSRSDRQAMDAAIAREPELGPDSAELLDDMRRLRNSVAHDSPTYVSSEEAVQYARDANRLIWALAMTWCTCAPDNR